MTIYNILEYFLFFVLFIELDFQKTKKYQNRFFLIGAILLIIILGFRNYNVGGDTPGYCDFFMGKRSGFYGSLFDKDNNIEIGFVILSKILHFICGDWRWYLFATTVISLAPFLWLVKKEAQNNTFAYLSFILPWALLFLIQTPLRQDMAISLFIFGCYLIINKTCKHNILIKLVGLLFVVWGIFTHTSMYLVAPIAFLLYFVPFNKKYSVLAVIVTLVLSLTVRSLFSYIYDNLYLLSSTMDSFDNINQYHNNDNYEISEKVKLGAVAPRSIFTILTIILSSVAQTNKFNYKCLVLGCCVMNISISFPLASRVALLFILVGASFVPRYFSLTIEKNIILNYSKVLIIVLFLLIIYHHYGICANFVKKMDSDILPYTFWFEHF